MQHVYEPKTTEWASFPDICNSGNHDSNISKEEYVNELQKTYKDVWSKIFDNSNTIKFEFTEKHYNVLRDATKVSSIKGTPSKIYEEEIIEITNKLDQIGIFDGRKWFARLSECSPKDGLHGKGPFTTAKQIMDTIVTSHRAANAFTKNSRILYIEPWRLDWKEENEFRVFVYNKKVTAITQYKWFSNVGWTKDKLSAIIDKIVKFCHDAANKMEVDSMVIDVIYNNDDIELVEFNSFGYYLASGSGLFHWLNDYDKLYNTNNIIYIRYIEDDF